ncbi:MAG: DUF1800 domain-containing protein [Acidobacteria bacterium]|nr:DUF1800 domain-containing protein [Acidobacteriota bacterium]
MYRKVFVWTLTGLMALSSLGVTAQEMSPKSKPTKAKPVAAKPLTEDQKVAHLLERITFGARLGDAERVKKIGWQKFLDEQLAPEKLDDSVTEQKLKTIHALGLTTEELARTYDVPQQELAAKLKEKGFDITDMYPGGNAPNAPKPDAKSDANQPDPQARRREAQRILAEMGYRQPRELVEQLQQSKIIRAVYSERQLQEVMTDFWFNHFNVFINKGADRILTPAYERDAIRAKAFGKFSDLLKATAESPAMLFYLDNWTSASPNAKGNDQEERTQKMIEQMKEIRRTRKAEGQPVIDEAEYEKRRTQMQQNLDRLKAQRRNRGINENYAREIMELHTLGVDGGYTQKDVQEVARCFTGWTIRQPRAGGSFYFNAAIHDDGEKIILGQKIPAGGGMQDGYKVIEILSRHPATAKFVSTKLARKFVSDNPPAALVDKMANTFRKTDGDMREVLRAMFTAPEFWSNETYRAKIKTPFEMTVSAVRALNGDTNGNPQFHKWITQMGEGLFLAQPPTGYPDTADHWVNTGALLDRMNFALALSANRINGTRVDLAKLAPTTPNASRTQLVDHFARLLLHIELSPQTRATIDKSLNEATLAMNNSGTNSDAAKIVGLLLGSPEFQRQ